jgi:hypothetical protein
MLDSGVAFRLRGGLRGMVTGRFRINAELLSGCVWAPQAVTRLANDQRRIPRRLTTDDCFYIFVLLCRCQKES